MRAIFLGENGDLVFIANTYALGIPLMTNAKIMDAYLCSYQYLEPDEVTRLVQELYNPFIGRTPRYRPTEAENVRSLESVRPLMEWRVELGRIRAAGQLPLAA